MEFTYPRFGSILQINAYIISVNGQLIRKDLELALHYNADYLNKIVKKHTGMTLTEYGQSYRMKQAARLICTTSTSISKISQELGFDSKAYFYRLFEKYYHMSPLLYRTSRTKQDHTETPLTISDTYPHL